MNEMTPKISVIVPVYKAEAYLHRCVDSLLAQTFTDFEILLVDDGSPDNSGEICDEYARKDSRVRVFHKENGGVSSARNMGLDNARGEYVCFVDSDDWVEEAMFATLLKSFQSKMKMDILFWGFQYDNSQVQDYKKRKALKEKLQYVYCDTAESILESVYWLEERDLFGWTWNKLFRREIIQSQKIRFDETISLQEDHLFTLEYVRYVKSLMVLPYYPYHYRVLDGSLISKLKMYREMRDIGWSLLQSRVLLCEVCESKTYVCVKKYKKYAYNSFISCLLRCLPLLYTDSTQVKEHKIKEISVFQNFLSSHNKNYGRKYWVLYVLSLLSQDTFYSSLHILFKLSGRC